MKKLAVVVACVVVAWLVLTGCKKGQILNNFTGWSSKMAENGATVRVDYIGKTEDGKVFDTSIESVAQENDLYNAARPYQPLEFVLGGGNMIPGFERGVVGMKAGETKMVTIPAEEAYGAPREDLVRELALTNFVEAGVTPEVGQDIDFGFGQARVLEVGEELVKLDFNHPLAGKTLIFEITLKEVIAADKKADTDVEVNVVADEDENEEAEMPAN